MSGWNQSDERNALCDLVVDLVGSHTLGQCACPGRLDPSDRATVLDDVLCCFSDEGRYDLVPRSMVCTQTHERVQSHRG